MLGSGVKASAFYPLTLTQEELQILESDEEIEDLPAWQQELLETAEDVLYSDDYLELPKASEIDEYSIMEAFCNSLNDPGSQDRLLTAIRGKGAFRRFKDAIRRLEIEDDWYGFRGRALEAIAVEWLESNGIPFNKDTGN